MNLDTRIHFEIEHFICTIELWKQKQRIEEEEKTFSRTLCYWNQRRLKEKKEKESEWEKRTEQTEKLRV